MKHVLVQRLKKIETDKKSNFYQRQNVTKLADSSGRMKPASAEFSFQKFTYQRCV